MCINIPFIYSVMLVYYALGSIMHTGQLIQKRKSLLLGGSVDPQPPPP